MCDTGEGGRMTETAGRGRSPGDADDSDYDAFLSYSHAADTRLAPAVQRGLHRLTRKWYQLRALRVFRDRTNLAANPDLWGTITTALRRSRFFVLMASPEAAASPWVDKEVEYWVRHRERETFLIVHVGGTIAWDRTAGDFDWERTDALPPRLRGWFHAEPLWIDLTWAREQEQLSVRHSRFRTELATLAAPVHGRDRDELDSEDVHQHRVATTLRRIGVGTLALLLVVALILGGVALRLQGQAIGQRDQALSRELAARAEIVGDSDPELARLLSLAAGAVYDTPEARAAMLVTAALPGNGTINTGSLTVNSLAYRPDGSLLASTDELGRLRLWDTATHRAIGDPLPSDEPLGPPAFTPDGRTVAAAEQSGAVRLWDVDTRQSIGRLGRTGSSDSPAYRLPPAFSPDGRMLAIATASGAVELWDVATRTRVGAPLTGHSGGTPGMAFSPDGALLVTASTDGTVRFWDVAARRQIGDSLTGHPVDRAAAVGPTVAFTESGRTVATAGIEGTTMLWDVVTRQPRGTRLTGYTRAERVGLRPSLAFGAEGRTLATGSYDGTIRLWNTARQQQIGEPLAGHTRPISAVAFAPDGRTLASAAHDGTIRFWDTTSHQQDGNPLTGFAGTVHSLAFSPDGTVLAGGGDNGGGTGHQGGGILCGHDGWGVCGIGDRTVKMAGGLLGQHLAAIGSEPLIAGPFGPTLVMWDVAERTPRATLTPPDTTPILSVAFAPDGRTIAAAGLHLGDQDGRLALWDVEQHTQVGDPITDAEVFRSLAFTPDGTRLVGTTDDLGQANSAVRVWDTATRRETAVLDTGTSAFTIVVSPDGTTVAAGRRDGTTALWDLATNQRVAVLGGHTGPVGAVAFSRDGRNLVTAGDDGAIHLWDTATRDRSGEPFVGHTGPVYSAAFSPDGTLLATGSGDGSVRLWDVATRKQVSGPHLRHQQAVRSVVFSPDGRTLASGGEDSAVRLWDIGYAADVQRTLCHAVGRTLTPDEWAGYAPGLPYLELCD
ncbi:TIR domain-containing protein [Saccharothrix stipae]